MQPFLNLPLRRLHVSIGVLLLSCGAALGSGIPGQVSEIAQPREIPPGAPQYSDVCFSSRWQRPRNANDPHDTFRDAARFHANRLDWVYSNDPDWIREAIQRGFFFGGAMNSIRPDELGTEIREKGRLKNREGDRVARTRWAVRGVWEGCVNHPDYREIVKAHLRPLADGGAGYIMVDDADANINAMQWGACWCEGCRAEAARLGMDLETEMLDFQAASVRRYFSDMREWLNEYAGRNIPWANNNYKTSWQFPYDLFDFGIAEIDDIRPITLVAGMQAALRNGKAQVYTYRTRDMREYRRAIAGTYATGQHLVVPWDVWMGEGLERLFSQPEQFADLYGFARGMAPYLDGYEDAAYWGDGLWDDRYGPRWHNRPPAVVRDEPSSIYAFTRARPGDADAAAVVHLIDWSDDPESFIVSLAPARFFGDRRVRVSLMTPRAYDESVHQQVLDDGDYSRLVHREVLHTGPLTGVRIPALNPWGILVIEPEALP